MSKVNQALVEYTLNFSTGIISQGYSEESDDDIRFKAIELSQEELHENKKFLGFPFLCHSFAVEIIRDKLVEIDWVKLRDKINSHKADYAKQYLEFGPNVLDSFSEEAKSQIISDEVISKFLSKTYTDIQDLSESKAFLIEWVSGLTKLMDSHPSLRLILLQAIESPGNFIIVDELENDSQGVDGLFLKRSQNALIKKKSVKESLATFAHESTHKVIFHIYSLFSPYSVEDRTNPVILDQLMKSEALKEGHEYSKLYLDLWSVRESEGRTVSVKDISELANNWLLNIFDSYKLEKYHNELLTFFVQEIASSILADNSRYNASPEFMKIIWEFLQISIILPLKERSGDQLIADEMPKFERLASVFPKSTNPVAIKAKQLITDSAVCLEWLDIEDGSGKLAFQAMHSSSLKEFFSDLFQLPEDMLVVKLRGCILPLMKVINNNYFIEKLFELPSETLLQIINAGNIEQLISASGSQLYDFINKLFELPSETLLQIINAGNIEQLISASGSNFISKPFELPSETLLQIINAGNIEQLISASGEQSFNFIEKLFALPSETLLQIINTVNIEQLISASGSNFISKPFELPSETLLQIINAGNIEQLISASGRQLYDFINKLFALPSEILLQIINAGNIGQLISASGEQSFNFIEKLFALPSETLLQIINTVNIDQLISASGSQLYDFINKLFALPSETLLQIINEKFMVKFLKVNLHNSLYLLLTCEVTQGLFLENATNILQELDQNEQEVVFDLFLYEDVLDREKLVLFLKEKLLDIVEVSKDNSKVIIGLMTSSYNLMEAVFKKYPDFLSQKICNSLGKFTRSLEEFEASADEPVLPVEVIMRVLNSVFLLSPEIIQNIPREQSTSIVKLVSMLTLTQVQDDISIRDILTSEKMELLFETAGNPEDITQKMTELLVIDIVDEDVDAIDLSGCFNTVEA